MQSTGKVYDAKYRVIDEKSITKLSFFKSSMIMTKFEIRRGLSGSWSKVALVLAGFILFGFLATINLLLSLPETKFWDGVTANLFFMLKIVDGPGAIIIIHVAIVGGGLIATDIKNRAVDLYFTKITLKEYFVSKISAAFGLTIIGMPIASVIYFIVVFYKRWPPVDEYGIALEVFGKLLLFVTIEVLFIAIFILFFSAYSNSAVNAGIIFFVYVLVSRVIFQSILYRATDLDIFYTLAPLNALDIIGRAILAPDNKSEQFLELSIFSVILYTVISLVAVYRKIWKVSKI